MLFELANIRSDDDATIAQAGEFLVANADAGVRQRPEDMVRRAIDTGQGFIVRQDGSPCGVSLIYKFDCSPDGPVYSEIGTMRVTANGYGLQSFLSAIHLLQIRIEDYGPGYPDVFAVVSPGTASAHNLGKAGFSAWQPPEHLASARRDAGLPFLADKSVLRTSDATFATAFDHLRSARRGEGMFATEKREGRIKVDLRWLVPGVLEASI